MYLFYPDFISRLFIRGLVTLSEIEFDIEQVIAQEEQELGEEYGREIDEVEGEIP